VFIMASTSSRPLRWLALLVVVAAAGGGAWWFWRQSSVNDAALWEMNNQGVALMEQFDYAKAAEVFESITKKHPDWLPAHVNLGIALLNTTTPENLDRALAVLGNVLGKDPKHNHADFSTGIILLHLGQDMERAGKHFKAVLERDPDDPHSWYFHSRTLDPADPEVKTCLEKALVLDPYLTGAIYGMGQIHQRAGEPAKAKELLVRHTQLMEARWGSPTDLKYGEMGQYAEVIGRHPRERVPGTAPLPLFARDDQLKVELGNGVKWIVAQAFAEENADAKFVHDAREMFGGGMVVLDYDGDDKLDVYIPGATLRGGKLHDVLLRNEGDSRFRDVTEETALAGMPPSVGCCVADYNNDGRPDLALTGKFGVRLLRNEGDDEKKAVHFRDVTKEAGLASDARHAYSVAFLDIDQDSDLDLVVPFSDKLSLFLNVGEALAQQTESKTAPLTTKFRRAEELLPKHNGVTMLAVVDADSDRDVDLVLAGPDRLSAILNDRLLKFHSAEPSSRTGPWKSVAVLDVNRDERSDLFLLAKDEPRAALLMQGKARDASWFHQGTGNAPPMVQAQALDLDLDGWCDIVGLADKRHPVLLQNQQGKLVWMREALGSDTAWPDDIVGVVAADIDGRCRADLLVWSASQGLHVHRNQGNSNHGLPVTVTGIRYDGKHMRTNADGIGARVSAQVRDHWTAVEIATFHAGLGQSRQPLLLGLGRAAHADFVSLRWPDGVWQAELNFPACQHAVVRETYRKPISCPVLFTYDGRGYTFVTDFIGAGTIGEPLPGGGHRPPRPDESVAIEAEQFVAKDGKYLLKITEPMDEATYLDRLQLVVIDHPETRSVYPDERFPAGKNPPTQDLLLFPRNDTICAIVAKDQRGNDVTATLWHRDRRTVDGFAKRSWIGWAEEHWVELDFATELAKFGPGDRIGLFLYGWTDYPYAESIFAADQAGFKLLPPVLERQDANREWRMIAGDLSFPAGLPRMMTYDVTGLCTGPNCKLRIRTNMHVYWDQIFVAPIVERVPCIKKGNNQGAPCFGGPLAKTLSLAATPPKHANNPNPDVTNRDSVRVHQLEVHRAILEHRGITQEYSPDGKEPTLYAYDRLDPVPVTRLAGKLTKFGDVTELLHERDDCFVIFGPGDEVSVAFDATKLPPLPAGWKRSFVLRTAGYCKDASPFTAPGGTIEPLPFEAMSNFPYGTGERYPDTPRHREYQRVYNIRMIGMPR